MGSKKRRVKSKPVRRRQRSITRTSGSKSESFHYDHLEPRQLLATFYVSNSGSDSNVGTAVDAPFETIQKAANEARAGDTVFIRGGTYREQVNLTQSGTETAPITFAAFNNENVTVTATDLLTGFVRSADPTDNNNIYTANLSGDASDSLLSRHELTVFVNGRVVQEAKSRNAADYLNVDTWETFNSANGRTVRDSTLVGSTDNYVGSFIRLRTSDFTLGESRVTGFDSSTGTLTLADSIGNPPSNGRYLLHDAVDLVDSAGEWHFNEETDTFTLWAPGGGDPDNQVVEVKRRAEAFDTNGRDYIHFENLTFTGGDLDARGSDGLVLDGIHVIASDRIFGPEFGTSRTALVFTGDNNVVRNSEFEQIWTAAIRSRGDNNHFVNNFFHDIAFSGGGTGGLVIEPTADANLVSHNTFTRSGRAAIIGTGTRGVIQHNDFSRIGRITVDVGAIYFFNRDAGGSVIRNNVFHDIGGKLNSGVYVDNYTTNLAIHHNVFHRVSPFGGKLNLPNSFILYYNNTIFNSGRVDAFGVDGERNSYGSKFFNNIYGSIDSDLRTGGDPIEFAGNFATTSGGNFVNAGAGDFRLRNSSGAVDAGIVIEGITDGFAGAAPDAGAYERGAALFEVGHDFNASPNPAYEFQTPAFSNLLSNSSFELGLSDWNPTGSPELYNSNSSNFRAAALGRYGARAARLKPGDGVSQTVTGLKPNTNYTVASWGKLVGEQLDAADAAFVGNRSGGAGPASTNHRGEAALGQLNNGDYIRFDDVDFGSGSGFYNQIQLAMSLTGSGDSVQVRLDSLNGPVLGSGSVPRNNEVWSPLLDIDFSNVTGVRDVFLIFSGSGNIGLFAEARLVNTNEAGNLDFVVSDSNGFIIQQTAFGATEHPNSIAQASFRTGPGETSATITILNQAGNFLDGYIDLVSVAEAPAVPTTTVDLSQTEYSYDVGTLESPLLGGWERLSPSTNGDIFWSGGVVGSVDRGPNTGRNNANRDFVRGTSPATLSHKLANGIWRVTLNMSDTEAAHDNMFVRAEGELLASDIDRTAGQFSTFGFQVTVIDGQLDLEFGDADSVNPEWVLNRLSLRLISAIEAPTTVDLSATSYRYDLQPTSLPTINETFLPLTDKTNGDLFWTQPVGSVDHGSSSGENGLNRDNVFSTNGSSVLEHKIADGIWSVLVTVGDAVLPLDQVNIGAEGEIFRSNISREAGVHGNETFEVAVSDGSLSLMFEDTGGSSTLWAATRIILTRVGDLPAIDPEVVTEFRDGGALDGVGLVRPDQLSTLTVGFNQDMNVPSSGGLVLINDADGSLMDISGITVSYDSTNFVATFDFSGLSTPLEPGYYSYVLGPQITSVAGDKAVAGSGADGAYAAQFYVALPGDANLDGRVDVLNDGFALVASLGTASGGTWATGDFDGDGRVDVLNDGFSLVRNLRKDVRPPSSPSAAGSFQSFVTQAVSIETTSDFQASGDADEVRQEPASDVGAGENVRSSVTTPVIQPEDEQDQEKRSVRVVTAETQQTNELSLAGDLEIRDAAFGAEEW